MRKKSQSRKKDDPSIKLAQFMAKAGVASRRASEELIRNGHVHVNGKMERNVATRVIPGEDEVKFAGSVLEVEKHVYYLLHKPKGFTCTAKDRHADKLAVDLLRIPNSERVFNIGRLDKNSEGLLLFTNDGDFANMITHPRHGLRKTYIVNVDGPVRAERLKRLQSGIVDRGDKLIAESVEVLRRTRAGGVIQVVIREGKKREVRRLCKAAGLKVSRLVRTAIGPLQMDDFRPGFHRKLTSAELDSLRKAAK